MAHHVEYVLQPAKSLQSRLPVRRSLILLFEEVGHGLANLHATGKPLRSKSGSNNAACSAEVFLVKIILTTIIETIKENDFALRWGTDSLRQQK